MSGKPITCRAAVLFAEGQPMSVESVLIAQPTDDQVRLKMVSAGVCASDGHYAWGTAKLSDWPGHDVPAVLGHEGAGIVESIGAKVTDLNVGDHVLTSFMPMCRDCPYCASPLTNICAKVECRPNKKLARNGADLKGFAGLGVYSEYLLVRRSQVVKINPKANLQHACIISCAVATGYYAALNQAQVQPGTTAAVWGLGAIGLNAIYGCKMAGARNIIGIDLNNEKKAIGEEFGVTEFVNPLELKVPLEQYLTEKYGGIDYAFECIGNQTVINTALGTLSPFGTLAVVGVAPKGTKVTIHAADLLTGRRIVGAFMGNKDPAVAYTELTEMYVEGRYNVDRLVTNKFSLEQINEAFQTLKEGKCIRSLIIFDA